MKYCFGLAYGSVKLMVKKEQHETPNYGRYTIFTALLDAMNEKKQKKSLWTKIKNELGKGK